MAINMDAARTRIEARKEADLLIGRIGLIDAGIATRLKEHLDTHPEDAVKVASEAAAYLQRKNGADHASALSVRANFFAERYDPQAMKVLGTVARTDMAMLQDQRGTFVTTLEGVLSE